MSDAGNQRAPAARATPEPPDPSGREFIEIADFSPGIFGDMHAATSTRSTADTATMAGIVPVNGAARIEGTERCRADKTGSLVPLPQAQQTGTRDGIGPTYNLQPNRLYRYVLDAQLGNPLVDTTLLQATPMATKRRPLHMMWGYWVDDFTDYHPVVLGREYRTWLSYPYDVDAVFDFMLGDAVGETVAGVPVYPLPIGSLCKARFHLGNTEFGSAETSYAYFPGVAGNYLSSPDAAALDILGDITVVARIAAADYTPSADRTIVSKWNDFGVFQRSWQLQFTTTGTLRFFWSNDGTAIQGATSTVAVPASNDTDIWVAATLDVNNGAAGCDVRFWTSSDGTNWTQLGTTVTQAFIAAIFNSTANLNVGSISNGLFNGIYAGKVFNISVRTGIGALGVVGGTEVFGFGPSQIPAGDPNTFTATTGQTVTKNTSGVSTTVLVVGQADINAFDPSQMYPVTVALSATPWPRWGKGNVMRSGAITAAQRYGLGSAPVFGTVFNAYHPGIGLNGIGTCQIAMSWHNPDLAFRQATNTAHWYYHYSERGNVFANEAIEGGPINPYLLVAHQGRVVMADRRRTRKSMLVGQEGTLGAYGTSDDLLWYSDYALPCQNPLITPLTTDGTPPVANAAYDVFPANTHTPYNKMIVAEDDVSEIGTVGVTTVDQVLVVKHQSGGAMISGDLDSPTVRRFPYIESTGGVVCKGAHTPIGFAYGSINGIYVWQGGDSTQKLSPQIDGFFWDHTNGTTEETYAGSRGRMAYWNGMICVPNNFVFDVDSQAWWRFKITDLLPVDSALVPYNCYDRDEAGILYAFPYKNKWPTTVSKATFPSGATNLNQMTAPNAGMSGVSKIDVRVAIGDVASGSTDRELIGVYDTTGNQRSWSMSLDAADKLVVRLSTGGAADTTTSTSAAAVTTGNEIMLLRFVWDAAVPTNNLALFAKFASLGAPEGAIAAALRGNDTDWQTLGTFNGPTAALFASSSLLRIGNRGATFSAPFVGRFFGAEVRIATQSETTAPIFALIPTDFPVNTAAASFPCTTGQTVTVTRAGAGSALALSYSNPPVPIWHTFDQKTLDNEYRWHGHPLVESRGRILSYQEIRMVATSKADASHVSTPATIEVTLSGFDERGTAVTPVVTTFTLANSAEPQALRKDVANFNAQYVSVRIRSLDPNTALPAPKIHVLRLGVQDRTRGRRSA